MKLSEYKKKGEEFTSKASEITRQLAFAGIIIIWIFRISTNAATSLPKFLVFPLIGLALTLLFDLLQYFVGGQIWRGFYKEEEKKAKEHFKQDPSYALDPETKHHRKKNTWIEIFYLLKVILLIASFVLLIIFLLMEIDFI